LSAQLWPSSTKEETPVCSGDYERNL
jgi:hypothetical protein